MACGMRPLLAFVLPAVATAVAALAQDIGSMHLQNNPVRKIIDLLQDMKGQLEADFKEDEDTHEKMQCWCETSKTEKRKAIELGTAQVEDLSTLVIEGEGKLKQLEVQLADVEAEHEKDKKALLEAEVLRKKEANEFSSVQKQMEKSLESCGQAVGVLKEANPSLEDVKKAASQLQTSQVVSLASAGAMTAEDAQMLKGFIADVSSTGASFLASGRTVYHSRNVGMDQIIGILQTMKADLENDLEKATEEEKAAKKSFEELKVAKAEEIGAGKAAISRLDKETAASKLKLSEDKRDLEDTQAALNGDKDFLAMVEEKCTKHDKEYDQRAQDRTSELSAVQDTIQVLDSDESFELFGKTVAFLQISQHSDATGRHAMCQRAAKLLQETSKQVASPKLILLALRLQDEGQFDKVKEEMKRMMKQLEQENKDEAEKVDWCEDEMKQNRVEESKAYSEQRRFKREASSIARDLKRAWREVNSTKDYIEMMEYDLQKASLNRQSENKEFQQTVADQKLAQQVLAKAKGRLAQVYGFMQEQAVASSGLKAEPPQPKGFSDYRKNRKASGALQMLETVIEDAARAEADATESEQEAESDYQALVSRTNTVISEYKMALVGQQGTLAEHREALSRNGVDFQENMDELASLSAELQQLHQNCDWLMENLQKRKAARKQEISGLKRARSYLSSI